MEADIEAVMSYFRSESTGIFLKITESFGRRIQTLERQWDENVYQELQSQHANELKKRLSENAERIIIQYRRNIDINTLRRELTGQVEYYVSQLLLKFLSK